MTPRQETAELKARLARLEMQNAELLERLRRSEEKTGKAFTLIKAAFNFINLRMKHSFGSRGHDPAEAMKQLNIAQRAALREEEMI